jgi:diguanylate cyclase (GGDEF)-like protein/PAS domain S-box-containing protein
MGAAAAAMSQDAGGSSAGSSRLSQLRQLLPEGKTLPEAAWRHRHRAMVVLLFAESIGLGIFSAASGYDLVHVLLHSLILAPLGVMALVLEKNRRVASLLVSVGLISASALLVHIWDGAIEGHFLFFVTIVVLALYEDWVPFLVAAAYVVLHHGVTGAIDPGAVYNHPDAIAHPWKWAAIHGGFVAAAGLASVAAWRLNESVRAESERSFLRAQESEERFRGAFEGAPIGMVLFTVAPEGGGEVLQVNRAMSEITGRSRDWLLANMADLVDPEDADVPTAAIERIAAGDEERADLEFRYVHADGHTVWVEVSISLLHRDGSGPIHAIAQVQDVTERKRTAEELTHQVLHDSLTGLPNRRSLFADLAEKIPDADTEHSLLLLLYDLNGFKAYNDAFGHPAGDSLLTRMGKRLEEALGDDATAYRMGGDEFCVLGWASNGDRAKIGARAAEALTEHGKGFTVTASYGSVSIPIEATSASGAVRKADQRMYASKNVHSRTSAGRQSADVLLKILSERSPDLGVHLDQVTALCEAVAKKLDLPEEELGPLLQGASLHDVGKAAIPDEILTKPGVLDEEEWEFIRRHTVIGERILSAAPALSRAAKLVRASHERHDGRGYPDQLLGSQIPLGARIIAVCDAFDAMTSHRPYRNAMDSGVALNELRSCAGSQFDPEVVSAFCEVVLDREREASSALEDAR